MTCLDTRNLAVIFLSGLTGTGVGLTYTELLLGLSLLPETINACAVGILPVIGGWLSQRPQNVFFFPVSILIGIAVALPSGNEFFTVILTLAAALLQGAAASAAFLVGWGARRLLTRRRGWDQRDSHVS